MNDKIYNPFPITKPIKQQNHKAADVVNPLICFLELDNIEFPLNIIELMIVAADKRGNLTSKLIIIASSRIKLDKN